MEKHTNHNTSPPKISIVVTAGGTGGHFFPAQALIHELIDLGYDVILITDRRTKAWSIPVPIYRVGISLFGRGLIARLSLLSFLVIGIVQAFVLLRRFYPTVIVGFGGYPSIPAVIAAYLLAIPVVLHEQNCLLGRANRYLASRARWIATSFQHLKQGDAQWAKKLKVTGNPVRIDLKMRGRTVYHPPTEKGPIYVVIFGGSQGARIFSDIVPPALIALDPELRNRLHVSQQARPEDITKVQTAFSQAKIDADVSDFFVDILDRIIQSHLIISRSGGSTIAELTVLGYPSILVPYPYALDDHQTANAEVLVKVGAAQMIQESCLTVTLLSRTIHDLLTDPLRLQTMAHAARHIGHPNAVYHLAQLVIMEANK